MKRCPKCNCGADFTNKGTYYAAHAGALTLGIGAASVASIVHPSSASHVAHAVHHNITENVTKHYKCTNKWCNYEWDE